MIRFRALFLLLGVPIAALGAQGQAQVTVRRTYDAGPLWRWLFGSNWRDLWHEPIVASVLDLQQFGGGILPFKSGGNQSATLHFRAAGGQRYVFRSVEKGSGVHQSDDLRDTPAERIIQDQASAGAPGAVAISSVLATAAGVLHPVPRLVVLPDDSLLGGYRKTFAGTLGYIEIKPANMTGEAEIFAHASKIRETDDMLDELDASLRNRLDARAYLTARLLDAVVGDLDRGADQWDWARYDSGGVHSFRPIAHDHDWAFMRANGLLIGLARRVYKKIGSYDPHSERLARISFMTHEFDRSQLVVLPRAAWDSAAAALRDALTAAVIDSALRAEPRAAPAIAAIVKADLTSRIRGLAGLVDAWYRQVNEQADVFAADGNERVEIDRAANGDVRVRMATIDDAGRAEAPAFDRVFTPDVTREIRVYLQEGNDEVIVRGAGPSSIDLRIVGGGGDDRLVDSSRVTSGGGRTWFYDAAGANDIRRAGGTHVDTRRFTTAQPGRLEPQEDSSKRVAPRVMEERRGRFEDQWSRSGDVVAQKSLAGEPRTWGREGAINPAFRIQAAGGLAFGAKYTRTAWGFREDPFASRVSAALLYGSSAKRFGMEVIGEWHADNSTRSILMSASASGFVENRFYGYGNDSPPVDKLLVLMYRDEVLIQPALRWQFAPRTSFAIGPILHYTSPRPLAGSPAAEERPLGAGAFGAAGARIAAERVSLDHVTVPHRGYRAAATATAYPAIWDAKQAFGTVAASLTGYLPLGAATLAVRGAAQRAWGDFPLQDAAYLGGRSSLRGYHWNRFAGDATLLANAELRMPLFRVTPIVRGDLGVIALADAGRAWYKGSSPGGWHTSAGGGISFTSLGRAVSVLYAHGEDELFYLYFGMPF